MKRLSVFAHYDKDNIIDEHVIYYLKALKEIYNTIIFVSDCYLSELEQNWKQLIKSHSDYPVELIESNSRRLKDLYENQYKNANLYRKTRYNILKNFPPKVRVCVVYIEKYTYKLLNRIGFNKLKKF